jgi:hypothetical protein
VVDGDPDAAWCSTLEELDNLVKGFVNTTSKAGFQWDDNHLYVYVDVEDGYLMHDSGNDWWNDDAVEIYIDADNSKGTEYGAGDFRYGFRWHWTAEGMDMFEAAHGSVAGVDWKLKEVSGGYRLEAAFPWSVLNHTPQLGDEIGVEVRVLIDDDGLVNDAIKALYGYSGEAIPTPSQFGTLVLGEACPVTHLNNTRSSLIRIYPSATRGMLTIEPDKQEVLGCKVYDVTGKVVCEKEIIGKSTLNVSGLPAGIYFIGFEGKGVVTTLKFTKL